MPKRAKRLPGLVVLGALAAGLGLAGCTVQPLYATGADGTTVQAELAAISILPAEDRLGQIIRNELLFAFTGGAAPLPARYELSLAASTLGASAALTPLGGDRSTGVSVTASYVLVDLVTGATITQGAAHAESRFTLSNQEFANVRAEADARERAAIDVAGQIRLAVAAALAAP